MNRKTRPGRDCPRVSELIRRQPALTKHERSEDAGAWETMFHRFFSRVRREVQMEVRTGYQDETGFHSGVKPVETEIQWPPVW